MKLPFRSRIALFTALAAAITMALVFLIVYFVVQISARNHLDNDILAEKKEVLKSLAHEGDSMMIRRMSEWVETEHQQAEVNPVFLQLFDAQGKTTYKTSNLLRDSLSFYAHNQEEVYFDAELDKEQIRQGQFPLIGHHGNIRGYLAVAVSKAESAIVLYNLRVTLSIVFPFLLVILFFATAFAAAKGIAPVNDLVSAARQISASNIQNRLPLPENEDEIHQLATTINALLSRIEGSMLREKQFTADASHEMRTPLAAIRGTLEVLLRKKRTPEQYEERISTVIGEVDRMHQMLDQLLQLARVEMGAIPINIQEIELEQLIKSILHKWQARMDERKMRCHLQIPEGSQIVTDASLIEIILDNLIGNAIKYSQPNGNLTLSWDAVSQTLRIADDGLGIDAVQLPYIFDRFYRTDQSRDARIQGAGLGLSIVKKLADLMQIQIKVQSTAGKGTSFDLIFSQFLDFLKVCSIYARPPLSYQFKQKR